MSRSPSRYVIASVLFLIFVYLSLNVALNLSALRNTISTQLEEKVSGQVEVGFLFLNWRMQPVLKSLVLTQHGPDQEVINKIVLEEMTLNLVWDSFFRRQNLGREELFRNVSIERAEITTSTAVLMSDEATGAFENKKTIPSTESPDSKPSLLPELPVSVRRWSVTVNRSERTLVQFSGEFLRFSPDRQIISSRLTRYQNNDARGGITLTRKNGNWQGRAALEKISLSNDHWLLKNDRWSGQLTFATNEEGAKITVDLNGVPGVISRVDLPQTTLKSELSVDSASIDVNHFTLMSDHFQSSFVGELDLVQNAYDLRGDFTYDMKQGLNDLLRRAESSKFSVVKSDVLSGTVAVGGPTSNPEFSGSMKLSMMMFAFENKGETIAATAKDVRARIQQNRINVVAGRIDRGRNIFELESGYLDITNGRLTSTLTGLAQLPGIGSDVTSVFTGIPRTVRRINNVSLPLNISLAVGTRNFETALAIKNGTVGVGENIFDNLKLLVSYSSLDQTLNRVNGHFTDPDGNHWNIGGRLQGPLTVDSRLNKLEQLLTLVVPDLNDPPEISFDGVLARVTVPEFDRLEAMVFQLDSGRENPARISTQGYSFPLDGQVKSDFDRLNFSSVRIGGESNRITVDGTVNIDSPLKESTLDLSVGTNKFDVKYFTSPDWNPLNGLFNSNLIVEGQLSDPKINGTIEFDRLSYRYFVMTDLFMRVDHVEDGTRVTVRRGDLNGNPLQGSFQVDRSFEVSTDLRMPEASLRSLFPEKSWMDQNARGNLSVNVNLTGNYYEPESWTGNINGHFDRLVLSHFPKISGIEKIASADIFKQPVVINPFNYSLPVKDGKVLVKNLTLNSPGMELKINGDINSTGRVNFDLRLTLMGDALKGFLQDLIADVYRQVGLVRGEDKLTIPMDVRGQIESPTLKVRRDEVTKNFRENLVIKLLTEPIGKPINELLNQIF